MGQNPDSTPSALKTPTLARDSPVKVDPSILGQKSADNTRSQNNLRQKFKRDQIAQQRSTPSRTAAQIVGEIKVAISEFLQKTEIHINLRQVSSYEQQLALLRQAQNLPGLNEALFSTPKDLQGEPLILSQKHLSTLVEKGAKLANEGQILMLLSAFWTPSNFLNAVSYKIIILSILKKKFRKIKFCFGYEPTML